MNPTHPLAGLDRGGLVRYAAIAGAVFVVVGAVMWRLGVPLEDRGAGIVALELAGTETSNEILDDWGAAGCDQDGFGCAIEDITWRAKSIVLLDFAWLAAYGVGGAAVLALLADRRRSSDVGSARTLDRLAWVMLAAAVCDAVENAALWRVLSLQPDGWAEFATVFALVKFGLVALVMVATTWILLTARRKRAPTPTRS